MLINDHLKRADAVARGLRYGPPDKIRLLIAQNVSLERTGGMSRIMGLIHDEITHEGNWEVDWFCADRVGRRGRGPLARLAFPIELCRFLRREWKRGCGYDAVNIHEPVAALPIALRRFFGSPKMAVTSHGLESRVWQVDREESRLGRKLLSWKSRLWRPLSILWPTRFALRRSDHVFCLNSEDQSYLESALRIPQRRITRLCPGAAPAFAKAAVQRSYHRNTGLLFAGTWRHHKGIGDLVKAFDELARIHPALTLTVLGSGLGQDEVKDCFPVPLRSRVEVIANATESEAAEHFAQADVFVLPSIFEGTPLTLIEAMASGLPIVTTATCGMRDVIRHQENGLLVPVRSPGHLARAISSLLGSCPLRGALGRAAAQEAGVRYQWSAVAQPVIRAYADLFAESADTEKSQ